MNDAMDATRRDVDESWWPELVELVDCLESEAARAAGRNSRALTEVCAEIERRLASFRGPEPPGTIAAGAASLRRK
jgi:hypothetical protein